jgi:hypothetical protein
VAYTYQVVTLGLAGQRRTHPYTSEEPLEPGAVLRLDGRSWLIAASHPASGSRPATLETVPARYRLRLRHPDGREEIGAFRRARTEAPGIGHAFTTRENGTLVSWHVVGQQLAQDERGDPYLDLIAERDYAEVEELPDHELEHVLAARLGERLPPEAYGRLLEATVEGLSFELVALDPGEEPDWDEATRFIDSLVLDEIEDDLVDLCGVDTDADPQETWLRTVKERLQADLDRFREDVEVRHDEIEEWDALDGRFYVSVGSFEDEADPDRGHGWMCRLVDSGALGSAGFARVRKTEILT